VSGSKFCNIFQILFKARGLEVMIFFISYSGLKFGFCQHFFCQFLSNFCQLINSPFVITDFLLKFHFSKILHFNQKSGHLIGQKSNRKFSQNSFETFENFSNFFCLEIRSLTITENPSF